jgi:hypothetical protein
VSCDNKNCTTCEKHRPANSAEQQKKLAEHLKKNPMPRQRG